MSTDSILGGAKGLYTLLRSVYITPWKARLNKNVSRSKYGRAGQ